ncbi:DNA replication/repair protein RecF [Psychrobium sp. 1_MG-2023]|uniref:DNA replication/repair protein RecF n=1 Tax=Psychrobium sp. 1_MG-2023 TaxID=3062624 RepID=UPI000C34937E|nr:DNA replication/repair protein RecF [Psychrobium sp. 1_MG-2023]MDP2560511.1 DNA replication/repair protein RecF [Psychrobium sp. 1_MG-2023]PKF55207.1 DNA replication/repair protein RecF [Alteromonadales bacterium alter-6D02]
MLLEQLSIHRLRNLAETKLTFSQLNVIYGDNGSGKTSVLEAIHYLALGRSFRTHLASRVINYEHDDFILWGKASGHSIGLQRFRSGEVQVKIDGEKAKKLTELLEHLPLQLITPDSFNLLTGGPKTRREFVDWGVFHIDDSFYQLWGNCKRLLKQRNSLLKRKASYKEISYWDRELVHNAQQLSELRNQYINSFNPVLQGIIERFLPDTEISINYYQGWDNKSDLTQLLEKNYPRDLTLGYTTAGPHKADLKLRWGKVPVNDALSRGQLKLLVCALRIAQGVHLQSLVNKKTIYLVDDLSSELDEQKRQILIAELVETGAQLFLSVIDKQQIIQQTSQYHTQMFHVEHGVIKQD